MSVEYGIVNDEGCLEQGLYSEEEAWKRVLAAYADEYPISVEPMCPCGCEGSKDNCEIEDEFLEDEEE